MKDRFTVTLTGSERKALLEAIRIGFEDGSLEAWGQAANRADKKLKRAVAHA